MSSATECVRVLLIDDHDIVRQGLHMLVESQSDLRVVGDARDGAGARSLAAREQPDVIVLDLDLGSESGLDLIEDLLTAAPGARILVLTGLRDTEAHRRAFHLGATGLVEKESAAEVLVKAIRKVRAGEVWLDRTTTAKVFAEMSQKKHAFASNPEVAKIAKLSARERDVTALIGEGLSNKRIAERLSISEVTVRHHLTSIFAKLAVHDRLELLVYAYRHGIAKPPSS